jgi:hypothetical protein
MFHICANSLGALLNTETDITPIPDTVLSIFNGHFFPQDPPAIIFAAAMSTLIGRARIQTPELLKTTSPFIRGTMAGLVPTSPGQVADYRMQPLDLKAREEIIIFGTQTMAGTIRVTALLGLLFSPNPPAQGDSYTMRGTSATAAVANVWTLLTVTFQNQIPQGNWAVTGMQHQSANGQAARLIFLGGFYRPGCMSIASISDYGHPMFRLGGLGRWGIFRDNILPNIEVLCNAADAVHEIYLDFEKA